MNEKVSSLCYDLAKIHLDGENKNQFKAETEKIVKKIIQKLVRKKYVHKNQYKRIVKQTRKECFKNNNNSKAFITEIALKLTIKMLHNEMQHCN